MAEPSDERAPLLAAEPSERAHGKQPATASETTPLLGSSSSASAYEDHDEADESAAPAPALSKTPRRWPSIIAIFVLALISVGIIVVAYFVPAAVEEYAKQGIVVEPTDLSLQSITVNGVRARIQANFRLDASRVHNDQVRRIGQATTWLVRSLGTEKTTVNVFLPEYANALLGSAEIPPVTVSLVDGHTTAIDIVADLVPGSAEGVRNIANQWLDGRLESLRLLGKADIELKSGFIPLGTHSIAEVLTFEANKLPSIPAYEIERIVFEEIDVPGRADQAMGAQVRISAFNSFPVQIDVPPLAFEILVPACASGDPYIVLADALTAPIPVRARHKVTVDVTGTVQELPDSLTAACPDSKSSPLDHLLKQYMSGEEAVVFVRGKKEAVADTPDWIRDILASVTLPVPFPGRSFDNLIRDFSLTDVHFTLPDPLAEPGDPDANPTVSGTILVTAGLPEQMNFAINVTSVRANADVFYHKNKLGELNLDKWQDANSTMTRANGDDEATLRIQSVINNAPLNVTDSDVLSGIISKLLFGGQDVELAINALVDIRVDTVLGQLELKDVPAEGKIPVKPLPLGSLDGLAPQVGSIEILDSTPTSITLQALVNITNPTEYTAHVPEINIHILCNDTVIGTASAKNLDVVQGNNTDIVVGATWNPAMGGEHGEELGRKLLSQFVSGVNTTFTVRAFHDSIPSQPILSDALSRFNFTVPAPHLALPGDGDDGSGNDDGGHGDDDDDAKPSFIREATFHFFSSTASFVLASPLVANTLYIESIDATAYYNRTEPVGTIVSHNEFGVPPGLSQSPKLPVTWSVDSVGFEKLRRALGGDLKLDAVADVKVRLGAWHETIHYTGSGIGAHVRP